MTAVAAQSHFSSVSTTQGPAEPSRRRRALGRRRLT